MRVKAAARAFNNTECFDAYDGSSAFFTQIGLYDDTKRDSEASERRIFSCAPEVEIPARKVVQAAGSTWIMGHSNPDTFRGEVIRLGYVAHEAPYLSSIQTLDQFCRDVAGVDAYAGRAWVKDLGFSEQSSKLTGQYHIHFSTTEEVSTQDVVTFAGLRHIVRSTTLGPAGTLIVLAEQMHEPVVEDAEVGAPTWDPLTEAWTGATATIRMVRMRWQALFQYRHQEAPSFGPEDIQLAVSKTLLTPSVGLTVTLSDGVWQINSVADEGVWLCRATRHV